MKSSDERNTCPTPPLRFHTPKELPKTQASNGNSLTLVFSGSALLFTGVALSPTNLIAPRFVSL